LKNTKKLRRFLRRMSERNGKSYRDSISLFYGKEISEINQGLLRSLHKKTTRRSDVRGELF